MPHSTSKDFMGTSLLKAGARLFAYSGMCRMTLNKKKQEEMSQAAAGLGLQVRMRGKTGEK